MMDSHTNPTSLAVGLVSYRRGGVTQCCLDALDTYSTCVDRVYIADNGSEDTETQSLLDCWEQRPGTTLIRLDRNYGPSAGRNRILAKAMSQHDVIALLDNDIVVLDGWDAAALQTIRDGADMVQAKLLRPDLRTVERGFTRENPDPLAANPAYVGTGAVRDDPLVNQRCECAIVGSGIVRMEVFRRIGLFDEWLSTGEDFDLSFRARAAGFRLIYEPRCEMVHDHQHDPDYDRVRADISKVLQSHCAMWETHHKALLNPRWFHWYRWLATHKEPAIVQWKPCLSHFLRRLRRKAVMEYCMRRHPESWWSLNAASQAAVHLRKVLPQLGGTADYAPGDNS